MVENSKGAMGKRLVNEEEFYEQTGKLRNALPEDIQTAQRVTRESSRVLLQAKDQAERAVSEAQNEAQRLLSSAHAEAERATREAQEKAEHLGTSSREKADRAISEAEREAASIVDDARREAERIVADAQQQAEQLLAEHTITQRAQQQAEETVMMANQEADTLRHQANGYAYDVLSKTGLVLEKMLGGIEQGKAQFAEVAAPPAHHEPQWDSIEN